MASMVRMERMTRTMLVAGLTVLWTVSPLFAQQPGRVHDLKASPSTTHIFFFDASLPPVLRIESGDVVRLETATGNPRWFENAGVSRDQIPPELYAVYEGYDSAGRGDHTLNGPIFVTGAEPGDVLEIRILSVDVRWPIAGQGISSRLFPGEIEPTCPGSTGSTWTNRPSSLRRGWWFPSSLSGG